MGDERKSGTDTAGKKYALTGDLGLVVGELSGLTRLTADLGHMAGNLSALARQFAVVSVHRELYDALKDVPLARLAAAMRDHYHALCPIASAASLDAWFILRTLDIVRHGGRMPADEVEYLTAWVMDRWPAAKSKEDVMAVAATMADAQAFVDDNLFLFRTGVKHMGKLAAAGALAPYAQVMAEKKARDAAQEGGRP